MFTADQLVAHLVGDYILQSHWMATTKRKKTIAAIIHGVTYTLPFMLITLNMWALAVICVSHVIIDRFGLARYVVWLKNIPWDRWVDCEATGYYKDVPPWMSVWLLIIADNTLHILINGFAIWCFT